MLIINTASSLYGTFERIQLADQQEREKIKQSLTLFTFPDRAKKEQKPKDKKKIMKSLSKKKGDEDLKNIYYVYTEKRYMGRKQIKNKLITVHAKTQLECKKKLTEAVNTFLNSRIPTKKTKLTLLEFWDKWYKQDKEPFIANGTKKDLIQLRTYLMPLLELSISKIDKDRIINFFSKVENNRTKEKMHIYLKACLKSAVKHGVIKKNPYDLIILPPRTRTHKQALTFQEQQKLLEYVKGKPIGIIILIYLLTGLRKKELNFKSIENDINFENNTLKAINLKGRNNIVRYKHIRLTKGTIKLIMDNLDKIHKYDDELAYREILGVMRELNIQKSIVNLRHTFATNHLYLGTPDYVISKEMGHSTSQITKDNYMDIDFNLTKEKIVKLYNNLFTIFG